MAGTGGNSGPSSSGNSSNVGVNSTPSSSGNFNNVSSNSAPSSNGNVNNQPKQMSADEQATQNNANNIKNAAEVAKHSANPYAKAAGHALSAADKLTGGKASQKLGSAMTKANKMAPGGKRLQNASNKLSESGASDKIGKAASAKSGGTPGQGSAGKNLASKAGTGGGSKSGDVGENRLKNSLANRGNNNRKNMLNGKKSESESSSQKENTSSAPQSPEGFESPEVSDSKVLAFAKKKLIMMLLHVAGVIFTFIILILLIVGLITSIFPFLAPKEEKSEISEIKNETVYQENNELHEDEVNYYEELDKLNEDYKTVTCKDVENVKDLNLTILHSILVYPYYKKDNEDDIRFDEMRPKIETLKSIIEDDLSDEGKCNIDYSYPNGELFQKLESNSSIRSHYSSVTKSNYTIRDVLIDAFKFAGEAENVDKENSEAMPDEFTVSDVIENVEVPFREYLYGVMYANIDNSSLLDSEKAKAYTIALTTNIVAQNNISINTQSISANTLKEYSYCVPENCEKKENVSDIIKNNINNAINSVYGTVLTDSSGKYNTVSLDNITSAKGSDYKEILTNAYSEYKLKEIREDSYANGVNFGYEKILTPVTFYAQYDYNNPFCGVKDATIFYYGCGTTSMAIIASTYENDNKYDPVYMTNEAYKNKYCGSSGTNASFFKHEADVLGYKYLRVGKKRTEDLNILTSHLKKGHLAIVHVLAGHFTTGGHYMVLGGIDSETKKVYVYDPYDRENKKIHKTGSGWYSLNDIIAKEAYAFYIMWKE